MYRNLLERCEYPLCYRGTTVMAAGLTKKLRTWGGDVRRYVRSLPARTRKQRDQLLAETTLTTSERELLWRVETNISRRDGMYRGDGRHYFSVGLSAIGCLEEALLASGLNDVESILDLPCGHGRVLRFLVQRFPRAQVTACDLDRDAVRFCARTFGANPAYSQADPDQLELNRQYDLIWSGSLITHLDEQRIIALLRFFRRHLAPEKLLVFTFAAEQVVDWMESGKFNYGIAREQIPQLIKSYRQSGFGYTDYPYLRNYGISLTSPDWLRQQVAALGGLREVYFRPHRWDNHQDVLGFVRQD